MLSVIILICVRVCWQMAEVRVYVRYILRFVTIISNWCKFILLVEKQKSVQKEIPHSPQKKKKKKKCRCEAIIQLFLALKWRDECHLRDFQHFLLF